MAYYHDLVTEKSWEELIQLNKLLDFMLIGGWATYLYTKSIKSKDIDIVVDFDKLPILEKHYTLSKNDRLKKYEAVKGEVQIDIYLPHYSQLGIPVEELITHVTTTEGFKIIHPDYLFALKIYTLGERGRSPKGRKDFLDLLSLLLAKRCDLDTIEKLLKQYSFHQGLTLFKTLLKEHREVEELHLNAHAFSALKKPLLLF